ncbi:hypothetical protein HID58_081253 [Brassica napus]|uniref:Apple domain-containing protein n=1 Tax=Brassica napus TaxID=3708 RepID=A0ABQ7Y8U6_BRANA|nr:hypothetical protein HID58_081253 [Brassica napus]
MNENVSLDRLNKLVSRDNGSYTLTLEPNRLVLTTQLGLATPGLRPKFLARARCNASQSFLRLDADGNLRIYYTFDFKVSFLAWEVTFELLNVEATSVGYRQNAESLGFVSIISVWLLHRTFHYYRLGGVDHFMTKYDVGLAVGERKCRGLCSVDCRCLGYFYDKSRFNCWISYELGTLVKVSDSKKVAYIKTRNV